ncbi:MAG: hypothetical protein ACM3VT_19475 [Solirubrobacterales bacterium]
MAETNPKLEIRNPKQARMTKTQKFKTGSPASDSVSIIWASVIRICFGFRASSFGFSAPEVV